AYADVAHPGVDHLRSAGGRPVAQAVTVCAQVRAALDDLAGDTELRLPWVVALLELAAARVLRDAAELLPARRRPVDVPVARPLPDVPGHVVKAVGVRREGADGLPRPVAMVVAPRELAVPVIREPLARRFGLVPPDIGRALEAASGGALPFR